jgi:Zn-dependent protease with chaperone function
MLTNQTQDWRTLIDQGQSSYQRGDFSAAEQYLRQAIMTAQNQNLPPEQLAIAISYLALLKEEQGHFTEAKTSYEQTLNILQSNLPPGDERILRIRNKLARVSEALNNGNGNGNGNFQQAVSGTSWQSPAPGQNKDRFAGITSGVHSTVQHDSSDSFCGKSIIRTQPISIKPLVTPKEMVYGTISAVIGVFAYLLFFLTGIGFFLVPFLLLSTLVSQGLFIGWIKSSAVRISDEQLPELKKIIEDISTALEMPVPTVYVANGEGMLNAFATRFLSRDFVVIYSNILEMAYEKGEAEVAFVLCHELAHIKRRHTKLRFLHHPASLIPLLGTAYSRACEFTCDRIATALCPSGAKYGLVALATGSRIYRRINLEALYRQFDEDHGFWTWFHEITATHPNLLRRIKAAGVTIEPTTSGVIIEQQSMRKGNGNNNGYVKRRVPRAFDRG